VATESASTSSEETAPRWISAEASIVSVLWVTYGSFYFCRQNISTALPGLLEMGYTKSEAAWIPAALKIAYAVGQLVNGQLAERISARKLLAVGMLGSAALNVLFGFSSGLYFLIFVWACNGYCQALGWTPCMRVATNWIPLGRRGRLFGLLGTSYQVTASATYVVTGQAIEHFGWHAAFYVPAAILAAAAVFMLVFLRESPDEPVISQVDLPHPTSSSTWSENLIHTLTNPALWLLAIALFLLDACRYGFVDWGVTHLKEVQGSGVGISGIKYAVLPAGGIAGALLAGWATDHYFHGRRAPVIAGCLVLLGLFTLVYDWMARTSLTGTLVLLVLIGFCIFGAQVLLVGTAPADVARRGTAAAAAGFVNFMGYVGAAMGDKITGYVAEDYGWQTATWHWAGWAFAGAAAAACLWNVKAKQEMARK
jgi:sugar phosphate permease